MAWLIFSNLTDNIRHMYQRNLRSNILAALRDTPIVLLNGGRQTGKSTLVQQLVTKEWNAEYITLDDAINRSAAQTDPQAFLEGFSGSVIIDEVQRADGLFLPIKLSVDRNRKPGRYLLTGSANIMLLPKLSDTLAGRMEILTLWPLSQGEINGVKEDFIDLIMSKEIDLSIFRSKRKKVDRSELIQRIISGGFPDVLSRPDAERRRAWFRSYLTTILERDVRDMSSLEGIIELPKLLSLLATRAANLLNVSDISRSVSIPAATLKRYMTILQATYLINLLPPWTSNLGSRLVKTPKLMLNDTGLLCHLLGADEERLLENGILFGSILENFVVMELRKQIEWSKAQPQMFHYRSHIGQEVDLVLEEPSGKLVGIEVKASTTVNENDFNGLHSLSTIVGKNFRRGIVLYSGSEVVSFGKNMAAIPVNSLWESHS